jgi:hypothetical protein
LREALVGILEEPEVLELQQGLRLVQHADDDLLPVDRRQGGDTQVERLAPDLHRDAAVLRHALLRDVQLGHDLES